MTHALTRRNVSAIAKLSLDGMSHAQRLEAIANAIGYETAAAMMATLKNSEGAPQAAEKPIRAVFLFGSTLVSAFSSNEKLRDRHGDIEGNIEEITFATAAELAAYNRGLQDAEGWMDMMCAADESDGDNYFREKSDNPSLDFVDWYEASLEDGLDEDEEDDTL